MAETMLAAFENAGSRLRLNALAAPKPSSKPQKISFHELRRLSRKYSLLATRKNGNTYYQLNRGSIDPQQTDIRVVGKDALKHPVLHMTEAGTEVIQLTRSDHEGLAVTLAIILPELEKVTDRDFNAFALHGCPEQNPGGDTITVRLLKIRQ